MKNKQLLALLLLTIVMLSSCFKSTTNSSPELLEDDRTVTDYITTKTNATSTFLYAVITKSSNENVEDAVLRIDLIKPSSFSSLILNNNSKAKELIVWLKGKLKNPEQYKNYELNEVTESTDTYPAPNVARTIKIKAKDL